MDWIMPKSLFDASGLSWDPMLKIKKVVLELIPDREMYTFFGKGRREGIYYFLIDSAKLTINIYNFMTQRKKKEPKHVIYLDTNNLYGYAMSMFFSNKCIQMDRS